MVCWGAVSTSALPGAFEPRPRLPADPLPSLPPLHCEPCPSRHLPSQRPPGALDQPAQGQVHFSFSMKSSRTP